MRLCRVASGICIRDRLTPGVEAPDGSIHVIGEHGDGTNAELIAVPAANAYPIPEGVSFAEAGAVPLVFETAYRMLVTRAGRREGGVAASWSGCQDLPPDQARWQSVIAIGMRCSSHTPKGSRTMLMQSR